MRHLPAGAAVAFTLVAALAFANGGFDPGAWVWAGAVAGWAAAVGLLLRGSAGALPAAWPWPALAALLAAWTLASRAWSPAPAQSLLDARRDVVYAAIVLALVVLAGRGGTWALVAAVHAALTLVLGVALARYLLGQRTIDTFEGYHLSWPLGYANAAGILSALGALLALAPAVDGRAAWRRSAGAATLPLFATTLALTGSDASWAALGAGLVVAAALAPSPAPALRVLALALAPAAAAAGLALAGGFSERAAPRFPAAALLGAVAAAAALAACAPGLARRLPAAGGRRLAAAGALLLAAGGIAAVAAGASTEPRRSYYDVAWHEYLAHPLLGSGAGTFGRSWLESGLPARYGGALDAHSLYLETLAELGPLGLALVLALLCYPLVRTLRVRAVPGLPAAAGASAAFLLHAGVDWDWELPAVLTAGLCCLAAVLVADERPLDRPAPRRLAAGAFALALGALSLAGAASSTEPSASSRATSRGRSRPAPPARHGPSRARARAPSSP